MKIFAFSVVLFALLVGCGQSESDNEEPSVHATQDVELFFTVGVATNGSAFIESQQDLRYSTESEGNLWSPNGVRAKGQFSRLADGAEAEFDLRVNLDGDEYTVVGEYSSSVPFSLIFYGTGMEDSEAAISSFKAGKGNVDFRGQPPYTNNKWR